MIWLHLVVVVVFMVIGARMGGIGVGLAGGAGVGMLAATGLEVDPGEDIPWTVIGIIVPVVCAVSALQASGGMDHLVHLTDRLLRKHPGQINYLGPGVSFVLTALVGTGHTVYSILPVIIDVSKERGIRPSRPLSMTVVASQVAIVASPISAATLIMVGILKPLGVGYLKILAVTIPTTFIGCAVGAVVASRSGCELADDPVYQERMAQGLVKQPIHVADEDYRPAKGAIAALGIFFVGILAAVTYATLVSKEVGLIKDPPMEGVAGVMTVMLTVAALIVLTTKKDPAELTQQSTFRAGMTAVVCILGVAWLGTTFIDAYTDQIKDSIAGTLQGAPWLLAVFLYFLAPVLFSHAAATAAFMPVAASLGVSAVAMLACYPAVSNYYLLPTYPTTVAAIDMDDTGSTRVGKTVLNHPFVIPGTVAIVVTVILGFLWAPIVL
ncbi:C4-dicarboxylate ABC transporter [Branchiibius sp. NY16-3462-2]|nr:C4-dicarboxylate ABC transporter [Branchiibius sp. NY16-3462-2]